MGAAREGKESQRGACPSTSEITWPEELRRRALRLDHLPLRPATARLADRLVARGPLDDDPEAIESSKVAIGLRAGPGVDPRQFQRLRAGRSAGSDCRTALVAAGRCRRDPWPSCWAGSGGTRSPSGSRRAAAREAGDPDPEALASVGPLCSLGYWAVAAVDPEWLREMVAPGGPAPARAERARGPGHGPERSGASGGRALGLRSPGGGCRLASRRSRGGPERRRG